MNWWSIHYNRPLKDPLLQTYTLEELAYEYYMVKQARLAHDEQAKADTDRIEENKIQAELDWADAMEKEERLEEESASASEEPYNPIVDPNNIEWMEKHMELEEEEEGGDLSIDFGNE